VRRREFIAGLGSAAARPMAVQAQQPAIPVIGWLSPRSSEADALVLPAFRRGLNAHGYVDGRNIAIEYRRAASRSDELIALATDLVRRRVAVMVAPGSGAEAMQGARGSDIPIVFMSGPDAVEMGLVSNLNRPGGNLTGVSAYMHKLAPKRMELLHQLLPHGTTIAVLENPTNAPFLESPDLQKAAEAFGKQIRILNASSERELDEALVNLGQMRADALVVTAHTFFISHAKQIVASATRLALPSLFYLREYVVAGGLMSYGSTTAEIYRVLGEYTGRILNGAKPGELPVQQPTKFELVINAKTAKTLGLTIPETLLATADEVIE
jgi:putative tryptophan/tyrosine transport system substrate-binding protein